MVLYLVFIVVNSFIYLWLGVWYLGYHGIFILLILFLWGLFYISIWGLYGSFILDISYIFDIYRWLELGNVLIIDFMLEYGLFGLVLLSVMGLGLLIVLLFVYFEMWDDKEGVLFVLLLILFVIFMVILVLSSNILVFYVGWEGIGIVSLFLIGFWSERVRGLKAVFKVFTINKLGDLLILIGIANLLSYLGCISFNSLSLLLVYINCCVCSLGLINLIVILWVIGGGVKSAQYGVHIWLLEAMEAPLGASALMHSSTLVVAGVLLVYKIYVWVQLSWIGSYILIIWGSWTALVAAIIACYQFELKVILAYSTISSMGFLYFLLGLGTLGDLLIYLLVHAFIKIYLFLIAGLVMCLCGGSQDIRWMGGLFGVVPYLFLFYVTGVIALGGLPYWIGYYCKSAIWMYLDHSFSFNCFLRIFLICSTFYTYWYLGRLGWLVFMGARGGLRLIYRYWYIGFGIQYIFIIIWLVSVYILVWWLFWSNNMWRSSNFVIYFLFSARIGLNLLLGWDSWLMLGLIYFYIILNISFYWLYFSNNTFITVWYYYQVILGSSLVIWLWFICEFMVYYYFILYCYVLFWNLVVILLSYLMC